MGTNQEDIDKIEKDDLFHDRVFQGMALGRMEAALTLLDDIERDLDGYSDLKKKVHKIKERLNEIQEEFRRDVFET